MLIKISNLMMLESGAERKKIGTSIRGKIIPMDNDCTVNNNNNNNNENNKFHIIIYRPMYQIRNKAHNVGVKVLTSLCCGC